MAALVITRWPLSPHHLFGFDNVNFALALSKFDPLASQPQAPGYPLFVLVSRLVHFAVPSEVQTGLVMGFLGSAAALFFIERLGSELFGPPAGWIAAGLLLFHPAFWMAGAVDAVRTFLAAGSLAVAWFVWRGQLKTAAVVFAVAGGFRPDLCAVLAPLFFARLVVRRRPVRDYLLPVVILVCGTLVWFLYTAHAMGGVGSMMRTNAQLSYNGIAGQSIWYSGFTKPALIMAALAAYWYGIGVLPWIWAVPFARLREWRSYSAQAVFLLIWVLPPFLLSAIVHFASPDHALAGVPVVCLAGAWVLSRLRAPMVAGAVAVVAMIALFVFPPKKLGREARLPWITHRGAVVDNTLDAIAAQPRGCAIVLDNPVVTSRQIEYYFPQARINSDTGKAGCEIQISGERVSVNP